MKYLKLKDLNLSLEDTRYIIKFIIRGYKIYN